MTTTPLATDEARVLEACEALLAEHPPSTTRPATFLGAQYDRGLAWVHFPEGQGGLGLEPKLQRVINERLLADGAPPAYPLTVVPLRVADSTAAAHEGDRGCARADRTAHRRWLSVFVR